VTSIVAAKKRQRLLVTRKDSVTAVAIETCDENCTAQSDVHALERGEGLDIASLESSNFTAVAAVTTITARLDGDVESRMSVATSKGFAKKDGAAGFVEKPVLVKFNAICSTAVFP
jgi:hypothetical protein